MAGPREWYEDLISADEDDAAWEQLAKDELKSRIPESSFARQFRPPELGNIRERALRNVTKRAQQKLADRAQGVEERLSPDTIGNLEDLVSKSDALIEKVRRQNKEFVAERRARALLPRATREAQLHRSPRDRTVAILGALERERRLNASLTRAASERAKATAASRHSKNKHRFAEGSLCAWWHNRKAVRQSVMIAKRLRRAPYSKFEERHGRRHIKKAAMEVLCG